MPAEDFAATRAVLQERKEKALADRLETQNQITKGQLVPRGIYAHYLGRIAAIYHSILYSVKDTEFGAIEAYLKKPGAQLMADVLRIVDNFCYAAVRRIKKDLDTWLRRYNAGD
jgi:hypothetical protein